MGIFLNGGANPTRIVFNGNDNIDRVIFRHNSVDTVVWQKKSHVTPSTDPYYDAYVTFSARNAMQSMFCDSTDYKIDWGMDWSSNPLTIQSANLVETANISIDGVVTVTVEDDDEDERDITFNLSEFLPSTATAIENGSGTKSSGLYLVKHNILQDLLWWEIIPSVINSSSYIENLRDGDPYKAKYLTSTGYSNLTAIYTLDSSVGSSMYWALFATNDLISNIETIARSKVPAGYRYVSHTWNCRGADIISYSQQYLKLTWLDSRGQYWQSTNITGGIGYGYSGFDIVPVY